MSIISLLATHLYYRNRWPSFITVRMEVASRVTISGGSEEKDPILRRTLRGARRLNPIATNQP